MLLGLSLALMAGVSLGGVFIAARKTGSASSWLLTISAMGQRSVACWVLAFGGLVDDASFEPIRRSPWQAVGLLAGLLLTTLAGNFLSSWGSKRCPAAVSATILTGVNMGVGYAAQVAIFAKPPKLLTVLGAVMMFLAVVVMALARLPPQGRKVAEPGLPETTPSVDSHEESLTEFIASEFATMLDHPASSDFTPVVAAPALRSRQGAVIAAATLGAQSGASA